MLSVQCTKVKRNCMVCSSIPAAPVIPDCHPRLESLPHVSKVCRKCTRKGARVESLSKVHPKRCTVSRNELSGAGAECGKGNIK